MWSNLLSKAALVAANRSPRGSLEMDAPILEMGALEALHGSRVIPADT